jgi:multisubunit Na+/H+ antiporter MnhB subunit
MSALMLLASNGGSFIGGLLGFVIWILIMVWIYNIAKRKGRHAVGWLILGFFFSLITLIVVALLPSKRTTDQLS